jgi:hypothetical protein
MKMGVLDIAKLFQSNPIAKLIRSNPWHLANKLLLFCSVTLIKRQYIDGNLNENKINHDVPVLQLTEFLFLILYFLRRLMVHDISLVHM